ncbi:MAG: FHA domain-containing protein [Leptolyngbyaceae cyanobacterium]
MIVCPNCNHQNPDGAVQCEACYTPLPTLATCPSCGASVQSDASFCGQCGFDLRNSTLSPASSTTPDIELTLPSEIEVEIPDLLPLDPLIVTEDVGAGEAPVAEAAIAEPPAVVPTPEGIAAPLSESPAAPPAPSNEPPAAPATPNESPASPLPTVTPLTTSSSSTQLQINQAQLFHVQTNTPVELPPQLSILHIGKPNDRIPPTIDVAGFPNSEIVSRVHANIRVEGDIYYLEDVGSSNGTYVNTMPLPPGNRHRLRAGDRIALGKGDKVTFIFQSG